MAENHHGRLVPGHHRSGVDNGEQLRTRVHHFLLGVRLFGSGPAPTFKKTSASVCFSITKFGDEYERKHQTTSSKEELLSAATRMSEILLHRSQDDGAALIYFFSWQLCY